MVASQYVGCVVELYFACFMNTWRVASFQQYILKATKRKTKGIPKIIQRINRFANFEDTLCNLNI